MKNSSRISNGVKKILVTGAGGGAAIGFCRSLNNSQSYYLIGTDVDPYNILFANTHKKYLVPRATDSKSYLKALNSIIKENNVDFVHVQPDKEIRIVVKIKDKLKAKTFMPSPKTIEISQNKFKTQNLLRKNNVPVPPSMLINNTEDIRKAFDKLGSPLWFRAIKGSGGKGSLLIKDKKTASSWIKYWDGFGNFMACEYLPGKNLGWDSIWLNGDLKISHTKERLAYVLPGGSPSGITGTAAAIRSIKRPEVEEICKNTILSIDKKPHGAFAVDLKEDKDGNPRVTEINSGRFLTSSLHFFAETGYHLPVIFVRLGLGQEVDLNLKYPLGKYMFRALDARPILADENYVKKILKRLDKEEFFEVK